MNKRKYLIEQIANLVLERILENQEPFFAKGLTEKEIVELVQNEFQDLLDTLTALQMASPGETQFVILARAADIIHDIENDLISIFLNVDVSSTNEVALQLQGAGYVPNGLAQPPMRDGLMDDVDAVNVRIFLAAEFNRITEFMMKQADMIRVQLGDTDSASEIYKLVTELRDIQGQLNKFTLKRPDVDRESLKLKSGYLARKADVQYGGKSAPRPGVFATVRSDYSEGQKFKRTNDYTKTSGREEKHKGLARWMS